jgi:hypothetical protein
MIRAALLSLALTFSVAAGPGTVTAQTSPVLNAAELAERVIHRRAVEAVIWGMPAVNYDLMLQEAVKAGGGVNQIVYWSRLPGWKNQTLTPNPDSVYLMAFFNTKDAGPVVLEIPPADGGSITGNIDNIWQVALEDAGPSGADQGKLNRTSGKMQQDDAAMAPMIPPAAASRCRSTWRRSDAG